MKKSFCVLCVLAMTLMLSGCGKEEKPQLDLVVEVSSVSSEINLPADSDVVDLHESDESNDVDLSEVSEETNVVDLDER